MAWISYRVIVEIVAKAKPRLRELVLQQAKHFGFDTLRHGFLSWEQHLAQFFFMMGKTQGWPF